MLAKRMTSGLLTLIVLATLLSGVGARAVSANDAVYHTISWGETLSSIARKYQVSVDDLVEANDLPSANVIYAGQVLLIPSVASPTSVYIVQPGDSLLKISHDHDVSVWEIAQRNGIRNINLVFSGQELVIPTGEEEVSEVSEPTKPTAPVAQEAILIESPAKGDEVSSPITITGWGSAFENTLAVDVLDEAGVRLGQGFVIVDTDLGGYGPFEGTVEYSLPSQAQMGRVQVYSISPRDGAIEHLSSVTVTLNP